VLSDQTVKFAMIDQDYEFDVFRKFRDIKAAEDE
jgi:hypothetical protein